jgi:hypothetical protein
MNQIKNPTTTATTATPATPRPMPIFFFVDPWAGRPDPAPGKAAEALPGPESEAYGSAAPQLVQYRLFSR